MAKRKTLGQICFEAFNTGLSHWVGSAAYEQNWKRAAAAVEREVLRRIEADRQHAEGPLTVKKGKP